MQGNPERSARDLGLLAVRVGVGGALAAHGAQKLFGWFGTMVVASSTHVDKGFINGKGGFEYPAVLGWSAFALALMGPGTLSLDHAFGHRLNRSWMRNLALAAAVPAAAAVIVRRRRTAAAAAAQPEPTPQFASS
jgi:putative oxidoreductase